jgi:hypothetical protein
MTLPTSGPLTISQIAAEFGVALPCAFPSAFYGKAGLPSSGELTLPGDFYGLSDAALFSPDGGTVDDSNVGIAAVTLFCTETATWTYTGGGSGSFASLASGASGTSIQFTCSAPPSGIRLRTFVVQGVAGAVVRDFVVQLAAESGELGP